LVHTAEQLAALHNLTMAEICAITSENAVRLFDLKLSADFAD
jgi:Tat protein secretion system quality control protein TatD with DNase activity